MTTKRPTSPGRRRLWSWQGWSIQARSLSIVIFINLLSLVIGVRSPLIKSSSGYYYFDGPFGEISLEFAAFITASCVVAIALWLTLAWPSRWYERRQSQMGQAVGTHSPKWSERHKIIHLIIFYAALALALTGPIYLRNEGEIFFFLPRFALNFYIADLFGLTATLGSLAAAFLLWRSGVRSSPSPTRNRPASPIYESADQELSALFSTAEAIEREVVDMKDRITTSLEMLTAGTQRVETELRARRAKLQELALEAQQYEQTAKLHKETSDAVRDFLTAKVSEQLTAIDRNSRRSQITFFFVGVLVSIPIGVVINLTVK